MRLSLVGFAALVALVVASFLAGMAYRPAGEGDAAVAQPRIVKYVCPMHPAYTSDRPGKAPCCGMEMVPVYEYGRAGQASGNGEMPASLSVDPSRQQLVGIQIGTVEKWFGQGSVRTVGRVVPDERLLYRITAATNGWIEEAFPNTVGSLVRRDDALATFYARESLGAQQAYFYALDARDRFVAQNASEAQMASTNLQLQSAMDNLRALGMSAIQLQEMAKKRERVNTITIRSPASAFVLERNISPGQRFESGDELYVLADLSKVWVLADIFEGDELLYKPGKEVRVSYRGQRYDARTSSVLPRFDSGTRTLKLRLELDNPGYRLRPDMFVDVEFEGEMAESGLTVPPDAIVDTGLRKTVFVDRGNGFFEPRNVVTGWRRQGHVQILEGLKEGERVVLSGTFLLDSESRMQAAVAKVDGKAAERDVICGMDVDPAQAKASNLVSTHDGHTYYFCSEDCKRQFDAESERFAHRQ